MSENNPARVERTRVARRTILRAAGIAGIAAPLGLAGGRVLAGVTGARGGVPAAELHAPICLAAADGAPVGSPATAAGPRKSLKLTWNATAICTVGVPVAQKQGLFAKHNLDVELVNFGGSTDQLLEAIATGKADAGVGMALRWLKPLEQGFDVRVTSATHGGCMRLVTSRTSGITDVASLRGKTIAVSDMASPAKNFFSIVFAKQGIDPNKDVEWRQYPADLLSLAIKKGEAHAAADGDPNIWLQRERDDLLEVATNLSGEYQHRACCVLGVRGSLIRRDRETAAALTRALLEAQAWTADHPDEAASLFAEYSTAKPAQLSAMLRSQTHHHHPTGADLRQELALYAEELKLVSVMKPSTDPAKFADKIFADVLA